MTKIFLKTRPKVKLVFKYGHIFPPISVYNVINLKIYLEELALIPMKCTNTNEQSIHL